MRFLHLDIWALLISLCACRTPNSQSSDKAIIGNDDRTILTENFAKKVVGSFQIDDAMLCTGFFSGPQEIMTTAHCLGDLSSSSAIVFRLASGRSFKDVKIKSINKKSDMAILQTDEDNSDFLTIHPVFEQAKTSLVSFDPDKNQFLMSTSRIDAIDSFASGNFLLHDLDTEGGASGSPLIQNGQVVGMHLGWIAFKEKDKPHVRNIALNLMQKDAADLSIIHEKYQLECKWDCSSKCCKKIFGRKVCEPTCRGVCSLHNADCGGACTRIKLTEPSYPMLLASWKWAIEHNGEARLRITDRESCIVTARAGSVAIAKFICEGNPYCELGAFVAFHENSCICEDLFP